MKIFNKFHKNGCITIDILIFMKIFNIFHKNGCI